MSKNFYRCTVCGDIHYGGNPPETCPTCHNKDVYEEIESDEAKQKLGL